MWADCFHISCNFPFLNEKSGTALDLNYCLGAETFEISKHVFSSMVGLPQTHSKQPSKSCPLLQSTLCQAQGTNLQKGEMGYLRQLSLAGMDLSIACPWRLMVCNKVSNGPYLQKSHLMEVRIRWYFLKHIWSRWHLVLNLFPEVSILTHKYLNTFQYMVLNTKGEL